MMTLAFPSCCISGAFPFPGDPWRRLANDVLEIVCRVMLGRLLHEAFFPPAGIFTGEICETIRAKGRNR